MIFTGTEFHIEESFRALLREHQLDSFDSLMACELGTPVSQGSSIITRRIELPDGTTVFLKKYHYGFKRSLRYWCRPSRANTEWRNLELLGGHGIPVPERMVFGERRQCGRLIAAIVMTLGVPSTHDFLAVAQNEFSNWSRTRRKNLIAQLAHWTAEMHRFNYYDRDLHFRNWLISDDLPDDESAPAVWVIDSPNGGCKSTLLRHRKIRDLADLDRRAPQFLRRTERVEFVRRYLGLEQLDEEAKELVRAVLRYNEKQQRARA